MSHAVVLSIGHDSLPMRTRSEILQSAGYKVIPAYSLKEAIAQFLQGDFDVIILYHTLTEQQRERITNLIREHTSLTPILSISANFRHTDTFSDRTIDSDPVHLVTGLYELLRKGEANLRRHGSNGDGNAA